MKKNNSSYLILSQILKIKFYDQLKDSGIELHGIYRMTNLQTGKENYLLFVNDQEIRFVRCIDFIHHFSNILISNIKYYQERLQYLSTRVIDEFTDEHGLERKYKEAEYYIYNNKSFWIK